VVRIKRLKKEEKEKQDEKCWGIYFVLVERGK
jgi:hypothetical protein